MALRIRGARSRVTLAARRHLDIRAMGRRGDRGAAIVEAIAIARRERFTAPEAAWLHRLDDLRAKLSTSTETLMTPTIVYSGDPRDATPQPYPVAELYAGATKPRPWTVLMFALIRRLRPEACLELGSCLGVSAAYQAAALTLNDHGGLTTIELAESRADHATSLLDELGLHRARVLRGRFDDVLPDELRRLGSVDFVFVDGHHDHDALLRYHAQIVPYLSADAVVVIDDIRWSDGMYAAWSTLRRAETTDAAIDLGEVGLLIPSAS